MQDLNPARKAWLHVAASSATGPERAHNEDDVAIFPLGWGRSPGRGGGEKLDPTRIPGAWPVDAGIALVLLDGMGGQSTGYLACEYALEALAERFGQPMPADPAARGARSAWLVDAISQTSDHVERRSVYRGGPYAAVVLAVAFGPEIHLVHVGDVRAYLLRDGRLVQLTRDDCLRNLCRDQGFSEEELREVPDNLSLQTLGCSNPKLQPHAQVLEVAPGDVLLICSKGLHTAVDHATLEETLRRPLELQEACRTLEDLAEAAGARHNITVMLARVVVR